MKRITLIALTTGILFAGTAEDQLNQMGVMENARIKAENARVAEMEAKYGKIEISAKTSMTRTEAATEAASKSKELNRLGEADNKAIKASNKQKFYLDQMYGTMTVSKNTSINRTELGIKNAKAE